jgi:dipeptidyl aminopeptidase/acylaminoacyl peptidase
MPTFPSGKVSIRIQQIEPSGIAPFPAILLLHGAGGNVGFWLEKFGPMLSRIGIACYAVHYFDRTGTDFADTDTIRDGHHFPLWLETISDAIAYIAARPGIAPNRIALLGVSLGAFLSLATSTATSTQTIRAVVEISGGLVQPYTAHATSAFPPTLILHGEADTVVPLTHATELDALLTRLSVPHQTHLFPGEGHWFSAPAELRILAEVAQFLHRYL